jgi:hypothetical protein
MYVLPDESFHGRIVEREFMNKPKKNWLELFSVVALAGAFLLLIVVNICWGNNWIDSDMAAEMIFSKLIAEEGGLIATTNWFYSTEFRILYTQLIMVPLFHIFEDWHVIRTITNIVTYVVLLSSYFYFMKPLALKKSTVIYSSVILLLPFSETIMTHVQMGNTYMPHMIIIFICFGISFAFIIFDIFSSYGSFLSAANNSINKFK